jgi:MraZ protein
VQVFTGYYEHTIDAKNRLAVPSDIRALLGGGKDEAPVFLYVTLGIGRLRLYTESGFKLRAKELNRSELDTAQLLQYERVMFPLTRRVEIDKQGRVLLPEQLLKMSGLSSDVVLLGLNDHLEVCDRQAWIEELQKNLTEQQELLKNPRLAMKKPAPPAEAKD